MPGSFHLFRFTLPALPIQRFLGPVPHDTSYYAKCMLGGILACGVTHAGITPLDVAKCNMQVTLLSSSNVLSFTQSQFQRWTL